MTEETSPSGFGRAVILGVQLLSSGATAYAGALTGDPGVAAMVAMAGTTIAEVGSDVVARVVSPRQEARVGAVFIAAGAVIKAREIRGHAIRTDGFWDGEHSTGSEFAEGVMLVAMNCYEERKLPYLANLLANVAMDDGIDATTANYAIRTAEGLSWVELCLLGIIRRSDDFPLGEDPLMPGTDWHSGIVKRIWSDLHDRSRLLAYPRIVDDHGVNGLYDLRLRAVVATSEGRLISNLMQLDKIPRGDLTPVQEALLRTNPAETQR